MTNTLAKLEWAGHIHIRPDWDDARQKFVAISPSGRAARDAAVAAVRADDQRCGAGTGRRQGPRRAADLARNAGPSWKAKVKAPRLVQACGFILAQILPAERPTLAEGASGGSIFAKMKAKRPAGQR